MPRAATVRFTPIRSSSFDHWVKQVGEGDSRYKRQQYLAQQYDRCNDRGQRRNPDYGWPCDIHELTF